MTFVIVPEGQEISNTFFSPGSRFRLLSVISALLRRSLHPQEELLLEEALEFELLDCELLELLLDDSDCDDSDDELNDELDSLDDESELEESSDEVELLESLNDDELFDSDELLNELLLEDGLGMRLGGESP